MSPLFVPTEAAAPATGPARALLLLLLSAGCLLAAPALLPPDYHWIAQSTSESAAQGLQGAWLARLGFLLFGSGVLALVRDLRASWAAGTAWMHAAFGHLMVATAVFSHRPWLAGQPFDPFEDWLHAVTATTMGFAFAFGVLARMVQRRKEGARFHPADLLALAASVLLPLAMAAYPAVQGLLQRTMFLVAYVWFSREALAAKPRPVPADKLKAAVQTV